MNEQEIKNTIFQLLKNVAPDTEPSQLTDDENFRETLGIDSFDTLKFIVSIDEKFGIDIPEEDYGKITTIKDLVGYIKLKKT